MGITTLMVSWASAEKIRVACVGDSITYGYGVKNRKENAFPALLGNWLGEKCEVKNFGVSGTTMLKKSAKTYWKTKQLQQVLAYQPNIILIKLGTNDANCDNGNWTTAKVFYTDYVAMVKKFLALKSHPKIYLCLPVPSYPGDRGKRYKVLEPEVLPAIRKVAKTFHLPVIDLFTPLSGKRKMFPDKLHPNAAGHVLIAKTIYKTLGGSWSWDLPKDPAKFHIFFLMGQSNMEGHDPVLPEDRTPVPHIVMLRTSAAWIPAGHPLGRRNVFGLGLSFAKEYQKKHQGVTVGLVNCANGGAPIDKLNKGTKTYKEILRKIAIAKKSGVIKAVLWHQGESDTITQKRVDTYEEKLIKLITDLRSDTENPNLPFVIGNLAEFYGTSRDHSAPQRVKQIKQVKAILRDIPKKVQYVGFVESSGLKPSDGHKVHFDRASYIEFGKRYAQVYEKMKKK